MSLSIRTILRGLSFLVIAFFMSLGYILVTPNCELFFAIACPTFFMHYLVHLPRVCGSDMEHTYSVVLGTKLIIVKEYLSLS